MAKWLASLFALALLAAVTAAAGSGAQVAHRRPTVSVFDVGWAPTKHMPWRDLTQADLFSLVTENGPGLGTDNLAGVDVKRWVAAAHAHHVQALISIGGSDDQHWQDACSDTNRAQFVANLVAYAVSHGFDGIDLDIEDSLWGSQGPPSPAMTTCIEAAASAAHAADSKAGKPLFVSADVITNWEGGWFAPSRSDLDQLNLMTYGDKLSRLAADVKATHEQGLPYAKMTVGIDVDDYAEPKGGCRPYLSWAKKHHLLGAFVWDAVSDRKKADNLCLNALAGHSR
jgi:hypothetical protein